MHQFRVHEMRQDLPTGAQGIWDPKNGRHVACSQRAVRATL
jgi:hypothetical protein